MTKSHSFSIYLLKEEYNATNALQENHPLKPITEYDPPLPTGMSLYVLDKTPNAPWWCEYFHIKKDLLQTLKGAICFVPVNNCTFAITFGHVSHNLLDTSYEYDFGMKVTLNSIDPQKLTSSDTVMPDSAKHQRTQLPMNSDLTYFDFDPDSMLLKSLTGKAKAEHAEFFTNVTGASNVRISSKTTLDKIPELCAKLLALYNSNDYLTTFPTIHNILPEKQPDIVNCLNDKLVKGLKDKDDKLILAIPAIIDYQSGIDYKFTGAGKSDIYNDISIDNYYLHLEKSKTCTLSDLSIENLKKHQLTLYDKDSTAKHAPYSIFKCLIYDTGSDDNKTYHLFEGQWYLVDKKFIDTLTQNLDPFYLDSALPAYNHDNEKNYNETAPTKDANLICLDRTNIGDSQIKAVEPCDLYRYQDKAVAVLHHVKVSRSARDFSHLFNQGINSIILLKEKQEARALLSNLISEKACPSRRDELCWPINQGKLHVSYDIVPPKKPGNKSQNLPKGLPGAHYDSPKEPGNKSQNLPLFSQISLYRAIKDLQRMHIPVSFSFIRREEVPNASMS